MNFERIEVENEEFWVIKSWIREFEIMRIIRRQVRDMQS